MAWGRRFRWRPLLAASALLLAGSASAQMGPQPEAPRPVPFDALPGWPEEQAEAALRPFLGSCLAMMARDPARPLGGAGPLAALGGRPADWAGPCAEAAALAPGDARAFLERRFQPFAIGSGLLTGYYEPVLAGTLSPDPGRTVPLRGLPSMAEGEVLPDRTAIEAGALDGLAPHLAHVDPVDAFFLQIQGSGRVLLPGGGLLRLLYAGKNGHPYRAVGRVLIERGEIPREAMSMQAIRAWLAAAPPEAARALLRENPSYVFFRRDEALRPDQGPPGTLGVPLTPGRSLAVDPAHVPLGAPVWIVARDPADGVPLRRLVHAQDTGGAIRGAARGDLFWGWGEAAGARAGPMRESAEVFVLMPRAAPPTGVGVAASHPGADPASDPR